MRIAGQTEIRLQEGLLQAHNIFFVFSGISWAFSTGNSIVKRQIQFLLHESLTLGNQAHKRSTVDNARKIVGLDFWKTVKTLGQFTKRWHWP